MKNKLLFACSILLFFSENSFGQGAYIPYNRDYYHLIERYEILEGKNNPIFHTGFKPYRRDQVASYLDTLATGKLIQSNADRFNLNYLSNDNWEFIDRETENSKKPLLGGLYRKPSDFFHYRDSIFDFHINPVIYLSGGMEPNQENFRMRNSRGVEFRGSIDRKVSFYTYFTTTQTIFPSWVKEYVEQNGAVPGEGFWKRYEGEGYGYFSAMGHVNFNISKSIQAQFGHDRNFVGEGYRSLIISDFSNPYVFVKLNTKIWKFNLTNLWSQKTADVTYDFAGRPTDDRYPQKWFSHHRLGINIGKNLNVGVFESVMKNEFDWNYLNPLIFYRWVEHQLGTPDKVMLGTDLKWNFTPGMQFYGQFVLDEFVFGEFFGIDGPNSIRNKHALQAGYKYINAFKVSNLDLQLEYNQVRPYTYQEKFENQSFTNYRTPLAHPLGANFREAVAIVRYQPAPRFFTNLTALYQYFGDDPSEEVNFGKNVLKNRMSPNTGIGLFGNVIGQGVENRVLMANLNLSYMVRQNVFLDFSHSVRTQSVENEEQTRNTSFTQLSLRVNMTRNDFNY
ncbi:hypothetical protein A33Q_0737 [Indibacter alkaliphilus LW1]|uniref:Gliding motility protein RemB n=1 Tax=Indibacter alkaliphilus (strain CCUG 57479 / KCTC 22604 / LW1) TaxID=1189612 RepID=S2DJA5_INDAL|nr:hypothetical protein [Indibacter alkaliphilus]EOZ99134.1 hypothetical protein A33Q_0737 [Indibacter alkaliphilus LW1]